LQYSRRILSCSLVSSMIAGTILAGWSHVWRAFAQPCWSRSAGKCFSASHAATNQSRRFSSDIPAGATSARQAVSSLRKTSLLRPEDRDCCARCGTEPVRCGPRSSHAVGSLPSISLIVPSLDPVPPSPIPISLPAFAVLVFGIHRPSVQRRQFAIERTGWPLIDLGVDVRRNRPGWHPAFG
jgi:hypothetical protein